MDTETVMRELEKLSKETLIEALRCTQETGTPAMDSGSLE